MTQTDREPSRLVHALAHLRLLPEHDAALRRLSAQTRVSRSAFIREAVAAYLVDRGLVSPREPVITRTTDKEARP